MASSDQKYSVENDTPKFRLDWTHIVHCVSHEMYPALASIIDSIARKECKDAHDISKHISKNVIKLVKNKLSLSMEEASYLRELIQRARDFTRSVIYLYVILNCIHSFI